MSKDFKTEADCRLSFCDIVNGFNYIQTKNLYLKHFTEIEYSYSEREKRKFLQEAIEQGLKSEKETLALLAVNDHWTLEEEKAYQESIEELNSLQYSVRKLIIPQQIEHMTGMIKHKEQEIQQKFGARVGLIGTTTENYATQRALESHILRSFYKDSQLKVPYFTLDDADNLSSLDFKIFIDIYTTTHSIYFEKNFKRIAVCAFFLNSYSYSNDDPTTFYGKPLTQLTQYQIVLFSKGRYYKHILSQGAIPPPEEFYEDLDKVLEYYDKQYSIILSKRQQN